MHTATLLFNGKVLVTGGYNYTAGGTLAAVELYDAAAKIWTPTGSLNTVREFRRTLCGW